MTTANSDLSIAIDYNVGTTPVRLTVDDMYRHGYRDDAHWHDDWEFFAPIAEALTVFVNGHDYVVAEGNGLLVNSGRLHYLFTEQRQDCRFVDVALNPDMLTRLLGTEVTTLRAKMSDAAPDVMQFTPATPWQATVLDRLHLLGNAYRFGGSDPLTIATEALAICSRVLTRMPVAAAPQRTPVAGQQHVWLMVDFMQQHLAEVLTAEQVAAVVHISRSQCFNLFHKVLGVGPGEYLQTLRLTRAAELLRTTAEPVAEIASECGFNTSSHFIAVFKQARHLTPRQYRQRIAE